MTEDTEKLIQPLPLEHIEQHCDCCPFYPWRGEDTDPAGSDSDLCDLEDIENFDSGEELIEEWQRID